MPTNQFSRPVLTVGKVMAIRVGDASLVASVRHAVREALRTPDLSELADTVVLVASELMGNALRHGKTTEIPVRLTIDGSDVVLEVADDSDVEPSVEAAGAEDEDGRGLLLVAALADEWGSEPRDGGGKSVWARFAAEVGGTT